MTEKKEGEGDRRMAARDKYKEGRGQERGDKRGEEYKEGRQEGKAAREGRGRLRDKYKER